MRDRDLAASIIAVVQEKARDVSRETSSRSPKPVDMLYWLPLLYRVGGSFPVRIGSASIGTSLGMMKSDAAGLNFQCPRALGTSPSQPGDESHPVCDPGTGNGDVLLTT